MSMRNHYRSSKRRILSCNNARGFRRWLEKTLAKDGYECPEILAYKAVSDGMANSPQEALALIRKAVEKFI